MPRKTTTDAELQAMIAIAELLDDLTDDEAARVLRWVFSRYGHILDPDRPTATFPGQPDRQLGGQLDQTLRGPLGEPLSQDGAR